MPVSFRPINDRVLVEREASAEKVGALYLAAEAQVKPSWGKVIAVGPGKLLDSGERQPMSVEPGMRVCFGKYAGEELALDDVDYLVMRESDIVGVDM
jgi:chaperonin GroES